MINQLRHEALSGAIHDLAHVSSKDCYADCLTKASQSQNLIEAPVRDSVKYGVIKNVDLHAPFREMM